MPTYDLRCEQCHVVLEDVVMTISARENATCECGGRLESASWPKRAAHGPSMTRPLRLGGADVEVTTPAQLREYERKNPDARIVSKDDSWLRRHKDNAREKAERKAQNAGFKDLRHQRTELSKAR